MRFKVELVVADRGWILEKIAGEIAAQCPAAWDVQVTTEASDWADLHYFIPYSKQPAVKPALSVCFFTHREESEPAHSAFLQQAERADCCVSMSTKYADVLKAHGIQDVRTIETGVDLDRFDIRLQIGVVGRTYHTGRKGEDLVAQCMDLRNIEFLFTGAGWPGPSLHPSDDELPGFFQRLDYLLIPSRVEGGPVPLMEALASGCEVIAPSDIGFVAQFPHIPFENGDVDSLRATLLRLVETRRALRDSVADFSWQRFGERHVELFRELGAARGLPVDASPEPDGAFRKLYLVAHGLEGSHKGGPTTRMAIIERHAREHGIDVEFMDDAQRLSGADTDAAVVHVFNSWPLDSARQQIATARAAGYVVAYSPIALNLEYSTYYLLDAPRLLVTGRSVRRIRNERRAGAAPGSGVQNRMGRRGLKRDAKRVRTAEWYRKDADLVPVEGVEGQFEALRATAQMADGVVLLSRYEASFLQRIGCALGHHAVIENGVDADTMAAGDPGRFRAEHGLGPYALMVGRIEPRKNQAAVAAALADSDLTLVLVGHAVDERYVDVVRGCAGERFLHVDRIEDRELLASAYQGAAVFVMASWSEGAPLAALEAASAGTPLVLSSQSSEAEYFGNEATYVNPADLAGIAGAVEQLAADVHAQSAEQRAIRGRRSRERFSAARHAEAHLRFYRDLMAARDAEVEHAAPLPAGAPSASPRTHRTPLTSRSPKPAWFAASRRWIRRKLS